MLEALSWQTKQASWRKDGGAFIPYPATWIRSGRYEDEPPENVRTTPARPVQSTDDFLAALGHWTAGCKRLHGGTCENANAHYAKVEAEQQKASA